MHSEERAISLFVEGFAFATPPRLARNQGSGQQTRSDPSISSVTLSIMITTSNSAQGERDAQSITRCWTAHHRDVRAFPRANRTSSTAGNSIPSATSSTGVPPVSAPSPPWRFFAHAASLGESTDCVIPDRCAPHLRRFDQQKTQQRVALKLE